MRKESMITNGDDILLLPYRNVSLRSLRICGCIVLLTAAVLSSPATCLASAAETHDRLNVLLILSDDQRHSALGAAGNKYVQTPNLDRLASQSVRFTHAFVSLPICTPSRATLLTGRFEQSHGVTFFGRKLRDEVVPCPRVLAEAGYQTAFTGKWHNAPAPDVFGFQWRANMFMAGMGGYTDPLLSQPGEKPKRVKGHATELFTDAAIRFLKERDTARPFFLYLAYTAPHDPREPLPRYEKMYDPQQIPLPPNFMPAPPFDPGTLEIRDEKLLPLPRDPERIRVETARYYGLITHMDEQIGRVLKELEDQKLADRTIVIFASDNGLTLGAHGLLGKQTLYDEGVRVPLMIRHPRLDRAGQTRDALVYLADLMPTLFDWTGVTPPEGIEGRSLNAVYAGRQEQVRDAVFGRYDEKDDPRFRSIRTERYKLIRYLKLGREELFDLSKDPYELKDLSEDAAMRSIREDLHRRLCDWQTSQHDPIGTEHCR